MAIKRVLCPERVRKIPRQFSWVDQRLVRDRHIARCDAQALALYLLLLTVADALGLSYYADAALGRSLSLEPGRLSQARSDFIGAGLIAYQPPLYQVLALDPPLHTEAHELRADELAARFKRLRAVLGQAS